MGSPLVGQPRKRWIDSVNDLKKRGLDVTQARKMVHNRSEWQRFGRSNVCGIAWGMNP